MDDIFELRRYYNTRIHPELLLLDRKRKMLLWLSLFTLLIFTTVSVFALRTGAPGLVFFLLIPATLGGTFLLFKIRKFKAAFKPPVIQLILDYLKLDISYTISGKVARKHFTDSGLFAAEPTYYEGEDYFLGKIDGVQFEMCELDARAPSLASGKQERLFRGVFFHAQFSEPFQGKALILPKSERPYLVRTIKAFTRQGGSEMKINNPDFEKIFITYADSLPNTNFLLNPEINSSILKYRKIIGREIFISFVDSHFFLAIHETRDMLEPSIFKSVVSFKLINEFYEDLRDITSIIPEISLYR